MMIKYRKALYAFFVFLAFASSLVILTGRIKAESANRTVELVLDYGDIYDMCLQENISMENALMNFKNAGVTSIAFTETNLRSLQKQGRLYYMEGARLLGISRLTSPGDNNEISSINPGAFYVYGFSDGLGEMIDRNVKLLAGPDACRKKRICIDGKNHVDTLEIIGKTADFDSSGIGFDHKLIRRIGNYGFYVVLRPENRADIDEKFIESYFRQMEEIPFVSTVIFGGYNEALGFPLYLDATVHALENSDFSFGDIEVPNVKSKQKGAQYVGLKIPQRTVRVQSITPQYLEKLRPENAVDIFRLGVRERNIRVIYLRPYPRGMNGEGLLETNVGYIEQLKNELERYGFILGGASRFPLMNPSPLSVIFITLGLVGILMLLLDFVYVDKGYLGFSLLILALLLAAGLIAAGKMHLVQKIVGLGIAVVFPIYAFASGFEEMHFLETSEKFSRCLKYALGMFIKVTLITMVGGLIIAGLFSSTTYMLNIDQFRGVKIVMIVPPLITVLLYYLKGTDRRNSIKSLAMETLKFWQLAFLGFLGAVGLVYVLRTGNTADALATSGERQFRVMLENIFWVRPRFKDFFLGHPAMILTWGLNFLHAYAGAGLLVLFATIGQVNIVDTFAHVHTPVFISLVRILNGAFLGMLFGTTALGLYWAVRNHIRKVKNHGPAERSVDARKL